MQHPCWIRALSRPVGMCSRWNSCHGWKYLMTFHATPRPVVAAPLPCAQAPENLEAWRLVNLHQTLVGREHEAPQQQDQLRKALEAARLAREALKTAEADRLAAEKAAQEARRSAEALAAALPAAAPTADPVTREKPQQEGAAAPNRIPPSVFFRGVTTNDTLVGRSIDYQAGRSLGAFGPSYSMDPESAMELWWRLRRRKWEFACPPLRSRLIGSHSMLNDQLSRWYRECAQASPRLIINAPPN